MSRAALRALTLLAAGGSLLATMAGCAGPPWSMGAPLDGQPSIPRTVAHATTAQRRAEIADARAQGTTVLELRALLALDDAERLTAAERDRLFDLLLQRAQEFGSLGRAVPRSDDLRRAVRLLPDRAKSLRTLRALAERDAGDAWLAVGDRRRAAEAYQEARQLGAIDVTSRLMAIRDDSAPEVLPVEALGRAVGALPLRAVPGFAHAYIQAGGSDRATLERCLAAATQENDSALAAKAREALALDAAASPAGPPPVEEATRPAAPRVVPADLDRWVLGGASLSARLLPLATTPGILQPDARARLWSELMLAEDPTSPDVLEIAALIDGFGQRFGGTERKLVDLVFYSPDRYAGMKRAALIWERVGRLREACVQRVRAARWRDEPEDPTWRAAVTCTRRDPRAGDWRTIRQYVLERAPADRRGAVAASLDAPEERLAAERDDSAATETKR